MEAKQRWVLLIHERPLSEMIWDKTLCFIQDDGSRNRHRKFLFSSRSTNPIIPSLYMQSDQNNSLLPAAMAVRISWCLKISLPPPALTKSCWFCYTWVLKEPWVLPGNELVLHTQLIWNSLKKIKRLQEGQRESGLERESEEECLGDWAKRKLEGTLQARAQRHDITSCHCFFDVMLWLPTAP